MLNLSYSKEVILLSLVFLASYFTIDLFLIFIFFGLFERHQFTQMFWFGTEWGQRSGTNTKWQNFQICVRNLVTGGITTASQCLPLWEAGIQSKHSSVGCVPNVHNQRTNKREILRIVHWHPDVGLRQANKNFRLLSFSFTCLHSDILFE